MAKKKSQDNVPNPNNVQNRDIMQRLNFLYQASVFLGTSTQPVPHHHPRPEPTNSEPEVIKIVSRRQRRKQEMLEQRNPSTAIDLSRTYVRSMKVIGKKTTVRMDPAVKRTLCKGCEIVLVPGSTASVRVNGSGPHGHAISYTCLSCHTSRRIPAPAEPLDISEDSESTSTAGMGEPNDQAEMDIDTRLASSVSLGKRKKGVTRRPPLFARKDAGHIVYRGNERLEPQPQYDTALDGKPSSDVAFLMSASAWIRIEDIYHDTL
ncbi:RNAse P Rpr2/Rpp21/SNM1 subunit domain-containing protein [Irpex rosettiformis]|uniref:RNAse P Rpr2/Rpp21/SNM1 subunit domain-containing protein n=1 Tax=Irpex rosettiformis TaxID=378272 RepID=A0ACB8U4S8_9APHY|nr:RNAse P Rpr2/Rpp21/SNM1 subunit domain-containing protein [Irpex rosettiformis]